MGWLVGGLGLYIVGREYHHVASNQITDVSLCDRIDEEDMKYDTLSHALDAMTDKSAS
jgi:hypothetical protein